MAATGSRSLPRDHRVGIVFPSGVLLVDAGCVAHAERLLLDRVAGGVALTSLCLHGVSCVAPARVHASSDHSECSCFFRRAKVLPLAEHCELNQSLMLFGAWALAADGEYTKECAAHAVAREARRHADEEAKRVRQQLLRDLKAVKAATRKRRRVAGSDSDNSESDSEIDPDSDPSSSSTDSEFNGDEDDDSAEEIIGGTSEDESASG